ncbi:DUF4331 family protein [Corallococcus sp. EGB]|uniref:DUF4331 family protein n=1 Tax=Corallococcus sp. EGB TaxID=1521117 RepID=UPI001CBF4B63|nr:DUF4331 family protein [Corallococcus sp. EGB]
MALSLGAGSASASDHLDTPTVIEDPSADIADLFAWMSPDGQRLNLAMTVVAHRFSDQLQYVFHVSSGKRFGETTADLSIQCRFDAANTAECWAGDVDHVRGDASRVAGIEGRQKRFRVFAGLRDDPFFNNVKGTRAALDVAKAALQGGAPVDAARCPRFDAATTRSILEQWRQTQGGPGKNFLAGWSSSALVVSIDRDAVGKAGPYLAVWAGIYKSNPDARKGTSARPKLGAPVDRIGRPLTGNALIGPLEPDDVSDRRKEEYNRAAPADWAGFAPDLQRTLGLYDGLDGTCGNQWLANAGGEPAQRYQRLAKLLADDRLWINSRATVCKQYLSVELAELSTPGKPGTDCGGRTPLEDSNDVFRSLLALGATSGIDDGVKEDDHVHSLSDFPFLAAP